MLHLKRVPRKRLVHKGRTLSFTIKLSDSHLLIFMSYTHEHFHLSRFGWLENSLGATDVSLYHWPITSGNNSCSRRHWNKADDNVLDSASLKAFAIDKSKESKMMEFVFEGGRKHCGRRRNCWLPAVSPSSTLFSKAFTFGLVGKRGWLETD